MTKEKRVILILIFSILVLSLLGGSVLISIYGKSSSYVDTRQKYVKLTEIYNPSVVDQGEDVVLRFNLENGYEEYEMECSPHLTLNIGLNIEEREKTIELGPLEEKELTYTLHIPDYEGTLDFEPHIEGILTIKCHGPCKIFRRPRCIPLEYLRPVFINMSIKKD